MTALASLTAQLGYSVPAAAQVAGAGVSVPSAAVSYQCDPARYVHPDYIQERLRGLPPGAYRDFLERSRFVHPDELAKLAQLHTPQRRHHPAIAREIYSVASAGRFAERNPTESHVFMRGWAELGLDVYVPQGQSPKNGWPVAVIVPGGAFFFASRKNQHEVALAQALVRGGYAAVCVDCRQIQHTFPTLDANLYYAVQDVRDSLDWLDENKTRLGLQAGPIDLVGISAGAAVASLAAAHFQDSVHALASLYGVFDPSCVGGIVGRIILRGLYGLSPPELRERYIPLRRPAPAPMLLLHGGRDGLATPAHLGAMATARLEAELETYAMYFPNMYHGHGPQFTDFLGNEARILLSFLRAMDERRSNP